MITLSGQRFVGAPRVRWRHANSVFALRHASVRKNENVPERWPAKLAKREGNVQSV
jgi:hypothetical protein